MPDPGSSEISSSVTVIASNTVGVKKQVVVGGTEIAVIQPNGLTSQQLTDISNVNNTNMVKEAMSQAGSGTECETSHARVTGSVEEVEQFAVQETVVKETLAENIQTSSSSPGNVGVNEWDKTGNTSVESTVQVPNKDVKPVNYPDSSLYEENISGRNSGKLTGTSEVNNGCTGNLANNPDSCIQVQGNPILKSEVPELQVSNDILHEVDKISEQMQTIGTGKLDAAQCTQELALQTGEDSMEKGGNGKLNVGNEVQNNTSDNFDTYGDRSRDGKMVGERLNATMAKNDQETKENSKYDSDVNLGLKKDTIQKNVTDKAEKNISEKTDVDNQNSNGEGNKSDETNLEHVFSQGSVKKTPFSEAGTNVDSTVHLLKRNLTPSNESNQESSGIGRSADGNEGLENGRDSLTDCETPIVKREVPISEGSKEVFDKVNVNKFK